MTESYNADRRKLLIIMDFSKSAENDFREEEYTENQKMGLNARKHSSGIESPNSLWG